VSAYLLEANIPVLAAFSYFQASWFVEGISVKTDKARKESRGRPPVKESQRCQVATCKKRQHMANHRAREKTFLPKEVSQ